jgi:hypothetical protein
MSESGLARFFGAALGFVAFVVVAFGFAAAFVILVVAVFAGAFFF